jgi:hypothetical protein
MATTIAVSNIKKTVFGNKRIVIADLTFGSTNYPSGGISLTPSDFDMQEIEFLKVNGKELQYKYDYTNWKLLAYTPTTPSGAAVLMVEAVNADPTETAPVIVVGYGRG